MPLSCTTSPPNPPTRTWEEMPSSVTTATENRSGIVIQPGVQVQNPGISAEDAMMYSTTGHIPGRTQPSGLAGISYVTHQQLNASDDKFARARAND